MNTHGGIDLERIEYVVMDESDKYFELGMLPQVKRCITVLQNNLQITYALFSATIQDPVERLFMELMVDPVCPEILFQGETSNRWQKSCTKIHRLILILLLQ